MIHPSRAPSKRLMHVNPFPPSSRVQHTWQDTGQEYRAPPLIFCAPSVNRWCPFNSDFLATMELEAVMHRWIYRYIISMFVMYIYMVCNMGSYLSTILSDTWFVACYCGLSVVQHNKGSSYATAHKADCIQYTPNNSIHPWQVHIGFTIKPKATF